MSKKRANGEGNIRKRSDGRWEGRIIVGHKEDGKPIFRSVFAKTQKELMDKLHRSIETFRGVELTENANLTLGAWLDKWLEERMRSPVFMARAMYYGSDFVGEILVHGQQTEAVLEMVLVEPKWRGRGVASALIDEALAMLSKQGVPHLIGRCVRRNQSAVKMFRRSGFDWVRTECYLLGRDL